MTTLHVWLLFRSTWFRQTRLHSLDVKLYFAAIFQHRSHYGLPPFGFLLLNMILFKESSYTSLLILSRMKYLELAFFPVIWHDVDLSSLSSWSYLSFLAQSSVCVLLFLLQTVCTYTYIVELYRLIGWQLVLLA